jgi:hypothetical protein
MSYLLYYLRLVVLAILLDIFCLLAASGFGLIIALGSETTGQVPNNFFLYIILVFALLSLFSQLVLVAIVTVHGKNKRFVDLVFSKQTLAVLITNITFWAALFVWQGGERGLRERYIISSYPQEVENFRNNIATHTSVSSPKYELQTLVSNNRYSFNIDFNAQLSKEADISYWSEAFDIYIGGQHLLVGDKNSSLLVPGCDLIDIKWFYTDKSNGHQVTQGSHYWGSDFLISNRYIFSGDQCKLSSFRTILGKRVDVVRLWGLQHEPHNIDYIYARIMVSFPIDNVTGLY